MSAPFWLLVAVVVAIIALAVIQTSHERALARAGLQQCRVGFIVTWQRECGR